MYKYRKKPIVIEAFQMTLERRKLFWPQWLHDARLAETNTEGSLQPSQFPNSEGTDELEIVTLEGTHRVSWGDYIIQGVQGELYPCKPDIFEATYEKVE
jgi:hypothetical protein